MTCRRLAILLLLGLPLWAAEPVRVISPRRIALPATEFTLQLGMSVAQTEKALQPLELDERGTDNGRLIYSAAVDVGIVDYTVDVTFEDDSLVRLAVFVIDSGFVDEWFRAHADSLPLSASYERAPLDDDLVRETWTTAEAVWITEHPTRPEPGVDMTFWEFRRR